MKRFCVLLAVSLLLCAGCGPRAGTGILREGQRLQRNIRIDGVDVSRLTVGEARELLLPEYARMLKQQSVSLVLSGEETRLSFRALGASYQVDEALLQAASLGLGSGGGDIRASLTVDGAVLRSALESYRERMERTGRNASISIDPIGVSPLAYHPEEPGITIDLEGLADRVNASLAAGSTAAVQVPYTELAPAVTLESIQEKLSLIAQYSTSFAEGSYDAENRVFNMQKAAAAIDGLVLQPGETFNCNQVLGDRNEKNGWKTAPGIRNGKYEEEYGGGVCQISSTLFNAVMMADLNITQRSPHSWPMGYVEIGRDATISTGGKNFCFVNSSDSPIHIFVRMDMEQKSVTASIYGRPLPDGMYIDIASEKTGTLETAGETVMLDESLPFQTRVVEREARDGKTSVTYKEYRAGDGSLLRREEVYRDTYRPIDGLTYVSTDLYYS